jgi:hypothetical protein
VARGGKEGEENRLEVTRGGALYSYMSQSNSVSSFLYINLPPS